ncbi:MAG TPA: urate hydroxylase PuuD, partial [Gemmatimonadaceae bacterium]
TLELLDLIARWVHVIAGIMWIGNSLLFNWLDRILEPSSRRGEGMQGETWLVHSGGFYFLEKTLLVGQQLPRPLHWFKWQAYTTWISGAVLLVVVYYAGGRALLAGGVRPDLSPSAAVAVAVGAIVAAWLAYDLLWRFVAPRSKATAAVLSLAALVALTWLLTHALSGRAAFLHVGAALGTIMAGNVAMTIMPSQRALVAGVTQGRGSDTAIAEQAKMRSIHNNYLTFPVVVLMLSSHFPSFYGHRLSWLILLVLIAAGAAVRHLMNVRFTYRRWIPGLAATVAVGIAALYLLVNSPGGRGRGLAGVDPGGEVTFAEVRSVIDRRCTVCHSAQPSDDSFGPAPGGAAFDTPEQIHALSLRIRERAVGTRTMPPANKTRITDEERAILGRWTPGTR